MRFAEKTLRHYLCLVRLLAALLFLAVTAAWGRPPSPAPVAELPVHLVRVGEVDIACRETGQGAPLLLLTGYACAAETWDATLVAGLASRHRVILCDNRGVGASTATDTPFSIRLFAADAAGVLGALGIRRADVLGWSMGAMAALDLALTHPDRVGRLVLIGAAVNRDPVVTAVARMGAMSREEFRASLFPPRWSRSHPGAVDRLPRPSGPVPSAVVARQRAALADWGGFDPAALARLDKPVLLVTGRDDWVTPASQAEALAGMLPRARLVRPREAGHWLMYQDPAALARLVNRFLVPEP